MTTDPQTTNSDVIPSNADVFGLQPTLSTGPTAGSQHKHQPSKASYSEIARNPPTILDSVPLNPRHHVALKPRVTMSSIISSPDKETPYTHMEDIQDDQERSTEDLATCWLAENFPEGPPTPLAMAGSPEASNPPEYDMEATETEEDALPPAVLKNGLLEVLESHLQRKEAGKKRTSESPRKVAKDYPALKRSGRLYEAVHVAARDGAAKYGSGRSPEKNDQNKVTGTPKKDTGKSDPAAKMNTPATPGKGWISKPAIPFEPSYVGERSWLFVCDELPAYMRGRTYLPPSPETLPTRHSADETVVDVDQSRTATKNVTPASESPFHWSLRGLEKRLRLCGYHGDLANYFGNTLKRARQSVAAAAGEELLGPEAWTVIDEKEERAVWDKIQADMSSSGLLDQSPIVPKTFEEYLRHKRIVAINRQMAALKKIREEAEGGHGGPKAKLQPPTPSDPSALTAAAQLSRQLIETSAWDGLTQTLARPSIWTQRCLEQADVAWPDPGEYAAARASGTLPVPIVGGSSAAAAAADAKPEVAEFALTPAFDMLCHHEAREVCGLDPVERPRGEQEPLKKPAQFSLDEINSVTASFVNTIRPLNGD